MALTSPGKVLRDAVADVTIQIPGAFSALVGRMIQDAGYDATPIPDVGNTLDLFGSRGLD